MEASVFSEYEMNEYDLKILIIKSVIELHTNIPSGYIKDLALRLNPKLEANLFIKELLVFVPELKLFGVEDRRLTPSNQLKLVAINLSFIHNNQHLNQIMEDTWRIVFSSAFLGLRYGIATSFIEKTLNEKVNGNPEIIVKQLSKFTLNGIDAELFKTIEFAEKEIHRVANNDKTSHIFNAVMSDFMEKMALHLN